MRRSIPILLPALLILAWASHVSAQYPGAQPASLPRPLYVRIAGPEGMQVTVYRGGKGVPLPAPLTIGVRPGYTYRLALSGMKRFPGQTFYPSLEVRGSLMVAEKLRASDFPAGLAFTEEDLVKVQTGSLVKKVIFLEKVDHALPQRGSANEPLEITVQPNRDPLYEARDRGLPLAVLFVGQREMTEEELESSGIPGTMVLPGDKTFPAPRVQPWMPWACYPVYDPISGPAPPWDYLALPDGGDVGLRSGFDRSGRLRGVDPSDTVAEYEDSRGTRRVAVSNRVQLLVPRFVVARGESVVGGTSMRYGPGSNTHVDVHMMARLTVPVLHQQQNQHLEQARERQRAGGTDNLFGTAVTGRIQGVEIKANLTGVGVVDVAKMPPRTAEPADRPLKIIKWPDKTGGVVGDVITFFVKCTNQGGQPITNVTVTDSLITRYEYVPGSARTDREASFTTQPNEAGSVTLRWEFPGQLLPRESALVSFQVRIR